jgi:hypothetical protein
LRILKERNKKIDGGGYEDNRKTFESLAAEKMGENRKTEKAGTLDASVRKDAARKLLGIY